jgi:hypothetical protein
MVETEETMTTSASTSSTSGALVADRSLAAQAGETVFSFRKEVEQLLAAHDGKRGRALNTGIDELISRGVLVAAEAEDVRKVAHAVYAVELGRTERAVAAAEVARIHQRLNGDPQANPVALAVAGVAATGLAGTGPAPPPGASAAVSGLDGTVYPIGAVAGAVTGALFGAAMGGLLTGTGAGAVIGAVIGAAVGAAIGACNKPDDRGGGDDPPVEE